MSQHAYLMLPAIGVPAVLLLLGALALFRRGKSLPCLMQVVGAAGLVTVVLAHLAEAFALLPWMRWGAEHSAGHYLDLSGAILGATLFPVGYLLHAFGKGSGPSCHNVN